MSEPHPTGSKEPSAWNSVANLGIKMELPLIFASFFQRFMMIGREYTPMNLFKKEEVFHITALFYENCPHSLLCKGICGQIKQGSPS
jgi:hypothetical protein